MSTSDSLTLISFPQAELQARALATDLNVPYQTIELHHFPDMESRVHIPPINTDKVAIYLSLDHPNAKLIELILAAATIKESGQHSLILVAPYMCYMRQDIAFRVGDAVSQKIIGRLLAEHIDAVITVDPHLHRTPVLEQAIPVKNAIAVSSANLQAEFLSRQFSDAILIGPDAESEQWVSKIAQQANLSYLVASKIRYGDHEVRIELPDADLHNRDIVLIDDIASTGKTLSTCTALIRKQQVKSVSALLTHALFTHETEIMLGEAGIDNIWSTDSVIHSSNRVSLTPLLAQSISSLIKQD